MISTRLMTESDIFQVAYIEKNIFSMPWSEKSFKDSLDNKNTLFVVALDEEKIIGYCGMYISFEEGNITNVAVAPAYRRKGVAKLLISKILELALQRGVTEIFLEVRVSNVAAISLYEQFNFRNAGIRKNFYEKPREDAMIMWKHNL